MTEKVLFEFRAQREDDGSRLESGHGPDDLVSGPFAWACWHPGSTACLPRAKEPRRARRLSDRLRGSVRMTLDFFEQFYGDLYGGPEPD